MSPAALEGAPGHQERASRTLAGAIEEGPSHAYLVTGPPGSGKAALARAFAAALLAEGAPDPEETRRRVMLDPSPHPDLVWLRPRGSLHAVADVREQAVDVAPLSPFEGGRRVFVVERAEALGEESQNAMLKTLEEPPPHACLILLASDRETVLPTVASRCQVIELDPLPEEVVAATLDPSIPAATAIALARLAGGDPSRAAFLSGEQGTGLRGAVETLMTSVLEGRLGTSPWLGLIGIAEAAGADAAEASQAGLEAEAELGVKHTKAESEAAVKRAARTARTKVLDLGLVLAASWARDWAVIASGAPEQAFNQDRLDMIGPQADGLPVGLSTEAVELVEETRRRLRLNVSEELALEALSFRLGELLVDAG